MPKDGEKWTIEVFPGVYMRIQFRKRVLPSGEEQMTITRIPFKNPVPANVRCKVCGSDLIYRHGSYRGVQRYKCRDCGATFMEGDTLKGMRITVPIVGAALGMFYDGLSLSGIERQLQNIYGLYPSDSTVYEWIVRFTRSAIKQIEGLRAHTGHLWAADETVLKVTGGRTKEGAENTAWFWDVIDEKTKFLLASRLSLTRTTKDAEALFRQARDRAIKSPRLIITDKLGAYIDGIEMVFGAESVHIRSEGMRTETHNNIIERFHGTLKDRTKVMRSMQNRETARLLTDGFLVHYNFIRPHEGLGGKTPAEVAKVKRPFTNWTEVVRRG